MSPPEPLFLEVETARGRTYLHQPVSLSVTLLADGAQVRNIQYPRLGGAGFKSGEFELPVQGALVRQGRDLSSYRFSAAITPTRSGTLQLGPAVLDCEMLVPAGGPAAFFGGNESRPVTLRSSVISLTVLPLPAVGRPAGFSGAVGRFTVDRSASPRELRAGDPVTVRTVIRGEGNLDAFSCTPVAGPGLRSYPPRSVRTANTLSCEQVLVPEAPGVRLIPAAQLSFFDPGRERYRVARSAALPLRVSAPPAAAPVASPPAPVGASRTAPTPTPQTGWSLQRPHWGVALVAVLCLAAGLLLLRRRRARLGSLGSLGHPRPVPPQAALRQRLDQARTALAAGDVELFYTALFRALQAVLGARPNRFPSPLTAGPLHERQPSFPASPALRQLLNQCDRVRYGQHRPEQSQMAADLQRLLEIIGPLPEGAGSEPAGMPVASPTVDNPYTVQIAP